MSLGTAGLAVALHLTNPDSSKHTFTDPEVHAADRHLEGSETFDAMEARNFNLIGPKGSNGENRIGFDNLVKATDDVEHQLADNQISSFGTLMASGAGLASKLAPGSITWLFIDEAQDLNAPQAKFVFEVQKQTSCRIFAIADDDQGIYKFRGASNKFLREFGGRATTQTRMLNENFRSTHPIVETCRQWIEPNWKALGSTNKTLQSKRLNSLPVVILDATWPNQRGKHAKIIIDAALKAGLIKAYGEVASFGHSPKYLSFDLKESNLPYNILDYLKLPKEVLMQWLDLCRTSKATGDWHHDLWQKFLVSCTADQKKNGDPILGHPGLNELYAALETLRRLQPGYSSLTAAEVFVETNRSEKFDFTGARMDPDYKGDAINHLSLHSCKGMEFPLVWISGGGFAYSVKKGDTEQGQPNLLGELGEWSKKATDALKQAITGKSGALDPEKSNQFAAELENRRLLYVGMSRATDLLMISAHWTNHIENSWKESTKRTCEQENAFRKELDKALQGVPHVIISSDDAARHFAASLTSGHRHPTWQAPQRYRVESFTSLTRQPLPGEIREVEIPRKREYPLPQSAPAMVGDLFHRIMHLLCLEPQTLKDRLAPKITDIGLVARVSTRDPATELQLLMDLLAKYFSDKTNQPWTWLDGAKSEVPFTHVTKNSAGETVLVKGYIDLLGFGVDDKPSLIVDYKTGTPPQTGSDEETHHAEQLQLYRDAIATTYECDPKKIVTQNYYIAAQACIVRP